MHNLQNSFTSSCRDTLPLCSPLEQAHGDGGKAQQQEQHPVQDW